MIELFGDATGNSIRAAIALEESRVSYEPRKVALARGEHRAAEYLQLNPTGRVPTLVDSDGPGGERLVLTQSNAIMLYIAEKTGTLLPSSAVERARALEWLFFFVTDVIAPNAQAFVLSRDFRRLTAMPSVGSRKGRSPCMSMSIAGSLTDHSSRAAFSHSPTSPATRSRQRPSLSFGGRCYLMCGPGLHVSVRDLASSEAGKSSDEI